MSRSEDVRGDLESPELHSKSKGFKSVHAVPSKRGIEVGDTSIVEAYCSLIPGQSIYEMPKDLVELVYLNIDGYYLTIRGRSMIINPTPTEHVSMGIQIQYRDHRGNDLVATDHADTTESSNPPKEESIP